MGDFHQNGVVTTLHNFRHYSTEYHADAIINGMNLDRHVEEQAVDLFAQNVYDAGEVFLQQPMHSTFIPSWKRVMSVILDFMDMFYDAVEKDKVRCLPYKMSATISTWQSSSSSHHRHFQHDR